jgi:hypothetical protein
MSCGVAFARNFLSKDLVKFLFRPNQENVFWSREKEHLSSTQALVDWEIQTEKLKAGLRFGHRVVFPKKPTISLSALQAFPCPTSSCRGFVLGGRCGSCKQETCGACREIMQSGHE